MMAVHFAGDAGEYLCPFLLGICFSDFYWEGRTRVSLSTKKI
jgi:hypothetical protein